jgi:RNA polymerase-binding transcription factor DksA
MKTKQMKELAGVLETSVKDVINQHWAEGYYRECEVCGEMLPYKDLETMYTSDWSSSLLCVSCFKGESEVVDAKREAMDEVEKENQQVYQDLIF